MASGHYRSSCFLFVVLLGFKHIFLYMVPGYFSYLLVRHILPNGHLRLFPVLQLSLIGLATLTAIFWPFRCNTHPADLPQLMHRLFPFGRGLTHAYWAPNVWAIYNLVDAGLSYCEQ